MIRWRFFITRVLIVIAVLALLRWSLGPIAHYASVRALQAAVGSRVDIAQTDVGFFPPRLRFAELQIGDPRQGKQNVNAFSAQSLDFVIDGNALLHRRFVASHGTISGIRIGGHRDQSGHLAPTIAPEPAGPSMITKMLGGLGEQSLKQLKSVSDSLETVKRSDQIRRRWKAQYADLASRAKELEDEIRTVRDEARGIDNPLRDLPRLQKTIQRAEAIHAEALAIRRQMDSLPQQIQSDRIALEEARQIDLDRINQYLPAPVEQPEKIGPDLLKEIVQTQIQSVRDYLDSAREIADWTIAAPDGEDRVRGEDVRLIATQPPPSLLVKRCQLDGIMSVNNDAYTMTGILENLTPETHRLTDPLRARLRLEGPRVVRVDYKRHYNDDQQPLPRDVLTVHWPNLKVAPKQVGNPADVQLAIEGGKLDLYVQIEAVGDQMRGQLVSRQSNTKLRLEMDPQYAKLAAVESIQETLSGIDKVEVQANFSGTWRDLEMQMATNLTNVLSRGVSDAMQTQLAASRQQLSDTIDREHRQQLETLQSWLGEQHANTRDLLARADTEIDSLKTKLTSELPGASVYVGKLRSAFKELQ